MESDPYHLYNSNYTFSETGWATIELETPFHHYEIGQGNLIIMCEAERKYNTGNFTTTPEFGRGITQIDTTGMMSAGGDTLPISLDGWNSHAYVTLSFDEVYPLWPIKDVDNASVNCKLDWGRHELNLPPDAHFDVYLDTNNPPTQIVAVNQSAESFQANIPLNYDTIYYWQIVPNDGENTYNKEDYDVWTFTTKSAVTPFPFLADFNDFNGYQKGEFAFDWNSSNNVAINNDAITCSLTEINSNATFTIPRIGPLPSNAVLTFDYHCLVGRNQNIGEGNKIVIQISTDNGVVYSPLKTINYSDLNMSDDFGSFQVALKNTEEQNVNIRFITYCGDTPFTSYFDNISVDYLTFAINPLSHDFQDIGIELSAEHKFTIENKDDELLAIKSVTLEGINADQFVLINAYSAPFNIAVASSKDITVKYLPTTVGKHSASLKIVYDDGEEKTFFIPLTGRGISNIIADFPYAEYFYDSNALPNYWQTKIGELGVNTELQDIEEGNLIGVFVHLLFYPIWTTVLR